MSNIEAIREKLISRKQELEESLGNIYKEKVPMDVIQDTGDQALASTLEDLQISLHDQALGEYKRIIKALDMIKENTYGICVECGKPISEKRLAVFPDSTYCLPCKEALEQRGVI